MWIIVRSRARASARWAHKLWRARRGAGGDFDLPAQTHEHEQAQAQPPNHPTELRQGRATPRNPHALRRHACAAIAPLGRGSGPAAAVTSAEQRAYAHICYERRRRKEMARGRGRGHAGKQRGEVGQLICTGGY